MNIEEFKQQFQYMVDLDNACLTAIKELYQNCFNINNAKYDLFRDEEEFIETIEKTENDIRKKKYSRW
jgi:hypothetical protein